MRRRIRDPHLVMEMTEAGQASRTDIAVCYMSDRVDRELLKNLKNRIESLQVGDLRMNQQSLAEALFKRKWFNSFPKFKYTERPDTAAACLLEGKVALNTRQKETILHPDQQALLDKKTGKLSVSDTKAAYSAEWTNDRLYFDEILLSDIIKELERSYDVKITVADDTLNTIRFYGNFRKREQSIQEIMNVLSSTDKMTYTMNGKNIVITLPK